MSQSNSFIDVVELCGLLQCLGFNVKSIDMCDGNSNSSSNDGTRTVVVDCKASGLHVVLESGNLTCSCPTVNQHNSGIWQVTGVAGGKKFDKEFGSTILGSLPKVHRERLTKELQQIVQCIKEHNESDVDKHKDEVINRSASMIEMKTPDKKHTQLKADTPTRYRSLDTLTAAPAASDALPAPGALLKQVADEHNDTNTKTMGPRQSTYTLSSTPDSSRRRNKTSSPLQRASSSVVETLIAAEKSAEELRYNISKALKELMEDGRYDSSSSLALDVSKIPILKAPENSKLQFASSPNLSRLGVQDDTTKGMKSVESASTSNLATKSSGNDGKSSRIRKISPKLFQFKRSSVSNTPQNDKDKDNKTSKLNSLFKPKIVTPVRAGKINAEASPNLSSSRKKFSNVKSTIPRPASKKE